MKGIQLWKLLSFESQQIALRQALKPFHVELVALTKPSVPAYISCVQPQAEVPPMYDAWFSKPVPVAGGISGDIRSLSNAKQAIEMLTNHWRNGGSDTHRLALRACRQAVNGDVSADIAMNAVVEAAREAHMLVE